MKMIEKVTKLALTSRIIILCLQFFSDLLIPDHNPDVFKSPKLTNDTQMIDKFSEFLFGGLRRWDAEYFLHIAENGYTYENNLAFYPLYPGIIYSLAKILIAITFNISTFRYTALVVAILLNIYFFYRAANCLYELTQRLFNDPNKSWNAVVLFCFNPASIFFIAPYSEGLYCWLAFSLMLECINHMNLFKTIILLSLTCLCRSNGLINIGYPIYFIVRKLILKKTFSDILKLITILILSLIPLTIYDFYAFKNFCSLDSNIKHSSVILQYGKENNYVLSGPRLAENSPWCDESIPFSYSYIQNHYWNVGFLKYYEFKQIPNFLLASPILIFLLVQTFSYLSKFIKYCWKNNFINGIYEWKSLPFILHELFLIIFCIFFVHIQISTRLLASANPCLYWFAANCLPKTFDQVNFKSKNSLIIYWFGSYFIIGTILFSNFFPWT